MCGRGGVARQILMTRFFSFALLCRCGTGARSRASHSKGYVRSVLLRVPTLCLMDAARAQCRSQRGAGMIDASVLMI